MLIKGGVTLITRGFGQTVTLEPYLFAEVNTDPYLCPCMLCLSPRTRTPTTPSSSTRAWSSAGFAASWGSSGRLTLSLTAPARSSMRTGTSSPMTGCLTWRGDASATARVSKLLRLFSFHDSKSLS